MSENEKIDRHIPVYPLPQEILDMKRDDTVCQFCGVSYLIHSEIKALEDKIQKLEAKLKNYDVLKEKEKDFNLIIGENKNKIEELNNMLIIKNQIISSLNNDIESKEIDCNRLNKNVQELSNEINYLTATNESNKKRIFLMNSILNSAKLSLSKQKTEIKTLEALSKSQSKLTNETVNDVKNCLNSFVKKNLTDSSLKDEVIKDLNLKLSKTINEIKYLNEKNQLLNDEINSLKLVKNEMNSQMNAYTEELKKLNSLNEMVIKLENEKCQLIEENLKAEQKMEIIETKNRALIVKLSDELEKSRKNEEELNSENKKLKFEILSFDKEIQSKDSEIIRLKIESNSISKQLNEVHKKFENELFNKSQSNIDEVGSLSIQIKTLKQKILDMENERNSITLAHQCQISQLKDSFREKYKSSEDWSEKLSHELNLERQRSEQRLKELENELRKNFKIELEIENEKYQEMLNKYKANLNVIESKMKQKISKCESENVNLRNEYTRLYEENDALKHKHKEEIDTLKDIIKELHESAENKVNSEFDSEEAFKLNERFKSKENEIDALNSKISSLQKQLDEANNQIQVLQETVRHECVERLELHDKLEITREELLLFKKNSYNSTHLMPLANNPVRNSVNNLKNSTTGSQGDISNKHSSYPRNLNELNSFRGETQMLKPIQSNNTTNGTNRSPSESSSLGSSSIQPVSRSNYTDTMNKSRAIVYSNSLNNNIRTNIFNKIQSNLTSNSSSSAPTSLANTTFSDNKKRISMLLARKS